MIDKPPDPALARFAAALARLREAAGYTRYALAQTLSQPGRPPDETALSLMERGERSPRLGMLCKIADALGCSLDELCGRDPP
jgi:transcriptional regulator with XRE-family HTH domain